MSSKDSARDTSLASSNGDGDSSRESGIDDGPSEAIVEAERAAAEALKMESAAEGETKDRFEISCAPVESFVGSDDPEGGDSFLLKDCDKSRGGVKKQKGFDAVISQQRRRTETLQWQKQRRDEILDKIRQLEDSAYSDSETEDEMDFVASVRETGGRPQTLDGITEEETPESMEVGVGSSSSSRTGRSEQNRRKQRRPRYRQAPCRPMLSEWLLEVPEDFEEMWLGVVCPVGKRCIVMASRGKTKIFSRSDHFLGSYKSLLPGGCKYHYSDTTTNRARGVTILDCIWSQHTQTFYVLDMICWNSHSCVNCDMEYRQYFLHSKFSENLELLERSAKNPFPFKPLMYFSASETSSVLSSPILFPEDIDGALFVHKEAFYISETNPLCLWILLTQVESILKMYVTPELLVRQVKAKNLSTRRKQMKRQDCKKSQEMEIHHN